MPKYTLNKLPKAKLNTDPGFGDDLLMEFLTLPKQIQIKIPGDVGQKKPDSLEDIYFSENEDEPSHQLSQNFGGEDMVEKGADIQVMDIFPKGAVSVEPAIDAELTEEIAIIRDQVNDYPVSFVLKADADPIMAPEIFDMDAEKFNMVWFFVASWSSVGNHPHWSNNHCFPNEILDLRKYEKKSVFLISEIFF